MTQLTSVAVKSLVMLLISSGTLATNLHAQSDAITVGIPFSFTVGAQNVAPGTYEFSLLSSHLLSVRDLKTGALEMFDVHPEPQRPFEQNGRLVFRKASGFSLLSEVHFPGDDTFSELDQVRRPARIETRKSSRNSSPSVACR